MNFYKFQLKLIKFFNGLNYILFDYKLLNNSEKLYDLFLIVLKNLFELYYSNFQWILFWFIYSFIQENCYILMLLLHLEKEVLGFLMRDNIFGNNLIF